MSLWVEKHYCFLKRLLKSDFSQIQVSLFSFSVSGCILLVLIKLPFNDKKAGKDWGTLEHCGVPLQLVYWTVRPTSESPSCCLLWESGSIIYMTSMMWDLQCWRSLWQIISVSKMFMFIFINFTNTRWVAWSLQTWLKNSSHAFKRQKSEAEKNIEIKVGRRTGKFLTNATFKLLYCKLEHWHYLVRLEMFNLTINENTFF